MERRVAVLVGGKKRIVSTIGWSETAEDVIKRLEPQSQSSSSYILLESWRGCSRMIGPKERVAKVLDGWGFGTQQPFLQLTKKTSNKLYKPRRIKRRYHCCKVAARKRDPPTPLKPRSKKAKLQDISASITKLRKQWLDYKALTVPSHQPQNQLSLATDVNSLPPELEDDFVALKEALIEEEKEKSDLQRRKEELNQNILSQQRELDTLMKSISTLDAQVKNEEHKIARLVETTGPPELESAQKEVTKLQNDFNVRTKLNKLQSSKIQEVNKNILKVEQETDEINKKIATLRLETHL